MPRPACVVHVPDLVAEKRPRFTHGGNVRSEVRAVGNSTGLTRMGVWVRSFEPGFAGTNRHYHEVEEEWAYVLSGAGVVRIGPLYIDVRAGHFVGQGGRACDRARMSSRFRRETSSAILQVARPT